MDDDENRRTDPTSRSRLDDIHEEYLAFNHRVVRILIGISVVLVVSLSIEGWLIAADHNRVSDIRESRLQVCRDVNERHDATIRSLDNEISTVLTQTRNSSKRAQVIASRQFTIALIDALAPKRNCQASPN